ncbi:unnamed protein product [Caenorhabditis auriculariae]|uniref:acid phosphatase n=1 Tax=Caenorhabditis auriculariae TaxID=2777116 RepID=A0A8S1H7I0_9PELO|nr:unnamed protein product [Caenorhabditis auriculariae]
MTKIWVFLGFVWVSQISIADPIGLKLIFSTAIWRHGDRAPLGTYPTDPIQENWWNTGGGGWGELTPTGMAQHFQLGTIIRNRYINGTFNFLPPYYDAKKIYVRATDHNRTIISAMANMVAMYTNPAVEKAGIEYPDIAGWPAGFVPIAAHSQDYDTDCVDKSPAGNRTGTKANRAKESYMGGQ